MAADYFQEVEEKVEDEIIRIRKIMELQGLGDLNNPNADVKNAAIIKSATDILVNNSVQSSQHGNDIAAIAMLRVAIEIDSTYWMSHYNLGWVYLSIGKKLHEPFMGKLTISDHASYSNAITTRMSFYHAALESIDKAIELNPTSAKAWCLLGNTQYYMGDYDQARVSLNKAIELDPAGPNGKLAASSLVTLENSLKS
jgi:tetratricopeptide (TPR) repeat protein